MSNQKLVVETHSAGETARLGTALSPVLIPGDVIVLSGDLGAGKTTFTQGLAVGLGITENVTSPTFLLMKEYFGGRYPLMHMDIYRLERIQEVIDLGYDEFLDPADIVVVEWGDMVEPLLPKDHLQVILRHIDDNSRTVELVPKGADWQPRMQTVRMLVNELFSAGRKADPGYFGDFEFENLSGPEAAN
ncbi:MAG: tRNA (adenosine(37)-N6)-threonylcarbamoyltransferase complex ATPase subunit type 1 TsaE [Actinomycetota bacterium]